MPIPTEKTLLLKTCMGSYLCMLHLKIASLANKHLDVHSDDNYKYTNIISFNETHLTSHISVSHAMLGIENDCNIFQHDHERSIGDVMLLVNTKFKPLHVSVIQT